MALSLIQRLGHSWSPIESENEGDATAQRVRTRYRTLVDLNHSFDDSSKGQLDARTVGAREAIEHLTAHCRYIS